MQNNFDKSLGLVLKSEGNYVNNSQDPGGVTNLGVTQRVLEEWLGHAVDDKTMRNLTPEQVAPLYKAKYWMACYAPQLKIGVDYMLFDAAVNMGPGRAVKLLQECLGCVPDGTIGPRTIQLIDQKKPEDIVDLYSKRKTSFYESLPTFSTFGKGWLKRVEDVKFNALKMIGEAND
jgi:lysozyme family protein